MLTWAGMPHFFCARRAALRQLSFSEKIAQTLPVWRGGLAAQLASATVSASSRATPSRLSSQRLKSSRLHTVLRQKIDEFFFVHDGNA